MNLMRKPKQNLPVEPTMRRKRITIRDAAAVAQLCENERLSYKEATALLGFNYEVWRNWLARAKNQARYDDVVARVRGAYIRGRLSHIKDAEVGKNGHRADWRSSAWLLERTSDRFSQQQPAAPPVLPAIQQPTINVWIESAYGPGQSAPKPGAVMDTAEVKQLPAPPEPEPAPPMFRDPDTA